ncbi:hypothetical protein BD289DRAFT_172418 [Coniella lustricola]|uniref:Uncharacterized protein n=1 Tax=Coniella lustricola TaxID=2025994 RepID=A0A2T2ZTU1_9PEZI|nr:hypothetical protein BD289DRAFT_172418 [Coniella lustricola]
MAAPILRGYVIHALSSLHFVRTYCFRKLSAIDSPFYVCSFLAQTLHNIPLPVLKRCPCLTQRYQPPLVLLPLNIRLHQKPNQHLSGPYTSSSSSSSTASLKQPSTPRKKQKMPAHRFLPPDPRPSKAHPEHRRRRKELEKEHNYEWVPPIILGLLGITLAYDVTKDVAKLEEKKKVKDRLHGGGDDDDSKDGDDDNDDQKSKSRSKSGKRDGGDRRGEGDRNRERERDRGRGESRRSQSRRSRKPWEIDDNDMDDYDSNDDDHSSRSEGRTARDGRRRRSRRWEVYDTDEVPEELAAVVGGEARGSGSGWTRQREADAWRRADLMEKGEGSAVPVPPAAERGRRNSLDVEEEYYWSRSGRARRPYRDDGLDYGYDENQRDSGCDEYGRYDRDRARGYARGRAEDEQRRRPRPRRRSSDW